MILLADKDVINREFLNIKKIAKICYLNGNNFVYVSAKLLCASMSFGKKILLVSIL